MVKPLESDSRSLLRLLVDGDLFEWQRFGGMSRYEQEILGRLAECHSSDLHVVHRRPLKVFAGRDDVQYIRLPFRRGRRGWRPRLAGIVDRWRIGRLRPDIFHPTFTNAEALSLRPRDVPMVITIHDMAYERLRSLYGSQHDAFRDLRAQLIQGADHVLCVSEFTRRELLDLTSIPEDRTSVVHHGISLGAPDPERLPSALLEAGDYVLYLGALWWHKNVKRLLRAYSNWPRRHEYRLVMAGGDQRWTSAYESLVESLKIRHRVLRLGALDDGELGATLNRATCLVYPSLYEGFGIPLLEAMHCGTLVVAAKAASIPEVAAEHAIYVEPEDESSIAEGLSAACDMSPAERERKLEAGRIWARHFTWDRAASESASVYRRVAGLA